MQQLKKILHKVFRLTGRDFLPYTLDNFYSLRRNRILENESISLVLDVGAHNGIYCEELREDGYRGRMVSFEPLSKPYTELAHRADRDPLWQCRNIAMGDSIGETTINVSGHLTSSSILSIADKHLEAMPSSRVISTEKIRVETLDSVYREFMVPDDNVFLKVDVQGYEQYVLRGAAELMKIVKVVEMELSLSDMFEGGPLLAEILQLLDEAGFNLVAINQVFSDQQTGHMLQADGIFIRRAA